MPAADLTALRALLTAWLVEYEKPRLEQYEDAAEEFYRETGMMAPGKSEPTEWAGMHDQEERRTRWEAWTRARADAKMNAVRTCLAALDAAQDDGATLRAWLSDRINEELRQIEGGDPLQIRGLYRDFPSFRPVVLDALRDLVERHRAKAARMDARIAELTTALDAAGETGRLAEAMAVGIETLIAGEESPWEAVCEPLDAYRLANPKPPAAAGTEPKETT